MKIEIARRFLRSLTAIVLMAPAATAADLIVISSMPMEPGLHQLAESYKQSSGQEVKVQGLGTADIARIITAGEPFDILVGTTALVDQAVAANRTVTNTRMAAGRVGIGVVVRSGSALPNISSPDTVRQAALSADGVVYNTAGSGQAVQRIFEAMGIAAQIQPKAARPTNAAQTMDRILQGKGVEIGFGLLSEIKPYEAKGIRLVGPLPAAIQTYTNYEAIISAASTLSEAARNFLRYIATPSAKQVFAATGVD